MASLRGERHIGTTPPFHEGGPAVEKPPFPNQSISFLVMSLGRRAHNAQRLIGSVSRELSAHSLSNWNSLWPAVEMQLLDTSHTQEESQAFPTRLLTTPVSVHRLSVSELPAFLSSLAASAPEVHAFAADGYLPFALPHDAYHDTRSDPLHAQPTSIQRNRSFLLQLVVEEQRLKTLNEPDVNRRLWIIDDDMSFLATSSDSVTGALRFHSRHTPSVFEQIARIDAPFSVGAVSGDSADPLSTIENNLDVMQAVATQALTITDPNETITSGSLHSFMQGVYEDVFSKRLEKKPLPVNESWWVGKTWKEAGETMQLLLTNMLSGNPQPLLVTPDSLYREFTNNAIITNFLLSPELLLLYPNFLPPLGDNRRNDIYWARSLLATLHELGHEGTTGNSNHPTLFHRQNLQGRSIGAQIHWREQVHSESGRPLVFRKRPVTPALFDEKIAGILATMTQIPWLPQEWIAEADQAYTAYRVQTTHDYNAEVAKGGVSLTDYRKRAELTYAYTALWRQMCQKLFPTVAAQFDTKYGVPFDKVPITISFATK